MFRPWNESTDVIFSTRGIFLTYYMRIAVIDSLLFKVSFVFLLSHGAWKRWEVLKKAPRWSWNRRGPKESSIWNIALMSKFDICFVYSLVSFVVSLYDYGSLFVWFPEICFILPGSHRLRRTPKTFLILFVWIIPRYVFYLQMVPLCFLFNCLSMSLHISFSQEKCNIACCSLWIEYNMDVTFQ